MDRIPLSPVAITTGGNCAVLIPQKRADYETGQRKERQQYVTSSEVRHGNHIDGLAFNFYFDSPYHQWEGHHIGGRGGVQTRATSKKNGYLAYFEGSGGAYVDRLRFFFAPPEYFAGFDEMPETGPKPGTATRCQGLGCAFGDGTQPGNPNNLGIAQPATSSNVGKTQS